MSKLFSDPVYKEMSETEDAWLELAIEPFHFELNKILIKLPQQELFHYDFVEEYLKTTFNESYYSNIISIELMLQQICEKYIGKDAVTDKDRRALRDVFEIQVHPDTVVDAAARTMSHPITLIKVKDQFAQEEVVQIICSNMNSLICLPYYAKEDHSKIISRLNEIMDLIGATDFRKSRSARKKIQDIMRTMNKIVIEDEWLIRDCKIIYDACRWITSYLDSGNAHALMNFTRLKCMTHKGDPIYSMEVMD